MGLLFYLAAVTLLAVIVSIAALERGKRSIRALKDITFRKESNPPFVSVVIPVRNEQKNLEEALTSVLCQDYDAFEVIAVNDRSTDHTGQILDFLDEHYPKLRVLHIENLPAGWLGKTHALYYGALHASGDLFLFIDADIVMQRSVLARAVGYLQEQRLDHLVIGAALRTKGRLLTLMILSFVTSFMLFFMPWRAKNPKSKRFTGGGSFSLFRKHVYETIGTMKALAVAVDDDLKLGQRIKKYGFRQEFLSGGQLLSVEWYASAKDMIKGLTKNTFAALNFSWTKTSALAAVSFVYHVWPLLAVLLTDGGVQVMNAAIVVATLMLYCSSARFVDIPLWYAFGFPFAMLIHIFIIFRSAWVTTRSGGICWRGTFYPSAELRK